MNTSPRQSQAHAQSARSAIFATLDEMIAAGYGDVPQIKIPENWRDIPREVRRLDLIRVLHEEHDAPKDRIRAIEAANSRTDSELSERVMANERERRGRAPHRRFFDRPLMQLRAAQMLAKRKPAMKVVAGRRKRA